MPPSDTLADDPDGRDGQHRRDVLLSIVVLQSAVYEGEPFDQVIDGVGLVRGAWGRARLWRNRNITAPALIDDEMNIGIGDVSCPHDIAAADQIGETQTEGGVAHLRERRQVRESSGSQDAVIDRCREREQVVVKRSGSEIDVLLRQVLLHACENVSLCGRCMEAQQYQDHRSQADAKEKAKQRDGPWAWPQIPLHVRPVSRSDTQSIRMQSAGTL